MDGGQNVLMGWKEPPGKRQTRMSTSETVDKVPSGL